MPKGIRELGVRGSGEWFASIFAAVRHHRDKAIVINRPATYGFALEDRVLVVVLIRDAVTDAEFDWRFIQRQCDALDFE